MVGDIGTTRSADDRAQLILIGAISLAFILLGVVVVFNGVQYTETVSSGETGETLTNAETTDRELEAGIAGLIEHYDGPDSDLEDEIGTYIKDHYRPAKANHRPVGITVESHSVSISGSDATVTVEYTYRTNSGTVTRERIITREIGDAP